MIMVIGTVPLFQGMAAWFVVFKHEFGWSSTQLSWAFSLTRVEGSVMGPISGYLIEKLGARRMVLVGLLIAAGGFVLLSRMDSLFHLYASFVVISVGVGLGTWMPMMTTLNSWFVRQRSKAMAVAMEGFLIGGVLLIPLLTWAIDPDFPGRPGWRATTFGIGIFLAIVALPLSRLVRNTPEEYGQHPDGRAPTTAGRTAGAGAVVPDDGPEYTWRQAVRTKTFWLMTFGHACSSIVIVTIMVHLGEIIVSRGYSFQTVGWLVAVYTGVAAVFTLIGGYVGDRVPIRFAIAAFSVVQSAAVAVLLVSDSTLTLYLFGVLLGIGFGGRTPLTTAIRGVYFGRKSFASITGISMIPMNVMLLVAPLFAAFVYDHTGSFFIPMVTIAISNVLGSVMFLMLGKPENAPAISRPPVEARAKSAA